MALELNGTTGVSLVQDGVVVAADLNSALSDTIGKVKAWVNFNGTGTVAIRAGYNVSSISDNGTGDYTVNFTTAMSDINYVVMTGPSIRASSDRNSIPTFYTAGAAATTSSFRIRNSNITEAASMHDAETFYAAFLR